MKTQKKTRRYGLGKVNALSTSALTVTVIVAYLTCRHPSPLTPLILVLCWFSMLYFSHCLAHYIAGRALGVKFRHYTLSSSMLSKAGIPVISKLLSSRVFLTLRLAERSEGWRGFVMFASGALASMLSPFLIAVISWMNPPVRQYSYPLFFMSIGNAVFTGYFSLRYGCLAKALRCLRRQKR